MLDTSILTINSASVNTLTLKHQTIVFSDLNEIIGDVTEGR